MATWEEVKARINNHPLASASWQSKKRSLLKVLTAAEKHAVDPSLAFQAPISNLSDILTEAKRAVRWQNWGDLHQLFLMAANLTNGELRRAIHAQEVESIQVTRSGEDYLVHLTPDQFARVKSGTRARHTYLVSDTLPIVDTRV